MLTGRLVAGPVRRVAETAQMVLDVMTTDGLDRDRGAGYQDVRRVRLMHAAVRNFIRCDPSVPHTDYFPTPTHGWCDGWGMPLNQEDLLGGLLTFTVSVFEVLDKLGVDVADEDLEAYLYRWKVVGALLGIREDLLPIDVAEAREIAALIRLRQLGPSNDGRQLTGALVEALANGVPLPPLRGVVPSTVRWYVGAETATMLGIGASPWTLMLEGPARDVSRFAHVDEQHSLVVQTLIRRLAATAFDQFMAKNDNRGAGRPRFEIPEELQPALAPGTNRFKLF